LAEQEALVASNRKLIKDEADARTEAELARFKSASAAARCEHAVHDCELLEERLQVVQKRAKEAEAAYEQNAKQLQVNTNLALLNDLFITGRLSWSYLLSLRSICVLCWLRGIWEPCLCWENKQLDTCTTEFKCSVD
jgi:hypothetical protein